MKSSPSRRGIFLAVLAGSCLLPSVSNAAVTVIGSGPDSSFLVLQSPNLGIRTYEINYTYNSGTQDGYFLLSQVLAAETSLLAVVPGAGNYFLQSITYNSVTEQFDGTNYWSHWVAGGKGFQNPDFTYNAGDAADGVWSFGYGMSAHFIEPGSWDAFYFSDGTPVPSVSPVPEPSSALLCVFGSLVIFRRRRNR